MYNKLGQKKREEYESLLTIIGALSNLFSENESPFLVSRGVENSYCIALGAENLGRADCSADASLNGVGIGIKTFLHGNARTLQKVAEFNKDSKLYKNKDHEEVIVKISELRNARIDFTMRNYNLTEMIYHCVTREPGKIHIFESQMDKIDISKIKNIQSTNKNTIYFEDDKNAYNFNLTKSTLSKRFDFTYTSPLKTLPVTIHEDPFSLLLAHGSKLGLSATGNSSSKVVVATIDNNSTAFTQASKFSDPHVILPLFSDRGKTRHVPERSGLNQWNAAGRSRNEDEVYIPIPSWVHKCFPNFFPERDSSFNLLLPNKKCLLTKVCQENGKALMSNPNLKLGEWILRDVLDIQPRELLTYDKLQLLGIDSVIIIKQSDANFSIDFCSIGAFDQFEKDYRQASASHWITDELKFTEK